MSKFARKRNHKFLGWIILLFLALIWGSSFILIKKGLLVYSPGEVAGIRILAASIFLLPAAIYNIRKLNRNNLIYLISIGLAGSFIPAFLFAKAQTQINSSVAGVLNALTPFFVLIVGSIFFRQVIYRNQSAGLLVGFVGTFILVTAGAGGFFENINYYGLFVVVATVCYGVNINLIKFKLHGLRAIAITSISLLIVFPVALIYLFGFTDFTDKLQNEEGALLALGLLVLLGVMGTAVALVFFNKLVQITSPVFTSSVTYLIPVTAVMWGYLDGEVFLPAHQIGMFIILIGVFITNKK